jgi:hypothetical protein
VYMHISGLHTESRHYCMIMLMPGWTTGHEDFSDSWCCCFSPISMTTPNTGGLRPPDPPWRSSLRGARYARTPSLRSRDIFCSQDAVFSDLVLALAVSSDTILTICEHQMKAMVILHVLHTRYIAERSCAHLLRFYYCCNYTILYSSITITMAYSCNHASDLIWWDMEKRRTAKARAILHVLTQVASCGKLCGGAGALCQYAVFSDLVLALAVLSDNILIVYEHQMKAMVILHLLHIRYIARELCERILRFYYCFSYTVLYYIITITMA